MGWIAPMPATREIGPRFTAAKYTTRYTGTRASTINSRGINRGSSMLLELRCGLLARTPT